MSEGLKIWTLRAHIEIKPQIWILKIHMQVDKKDESDMKKR